MSDITTVIIVKNEADRITDCISAAIPISGEVLVIDTGSTDNTIEVAKAAGAKVVSRTWQGYGKTKNDAHQLATHDWILSLDADEILNADLQKAISSLEKERGCVYLFNRIINYKAHWVRHCGLHPDWVFRLFHREDCLWNEAKVHEKLKCQEGTQQIKLQGLLEHYSFRSEQHFKDKIQEYAHLAAQGWVESGVKPSIFKVLFGSWWKYIQTYYIYRGYKDGEVGKEIATVMAEGVSQKLKHFKQLQKRSIK